MVPLAKLRSLNLLLYQLILVRPRSRGVYTLRKEHTYGFKVVSLIGCL